MTGKKGHSKKVLENGTAIYARCSTDHQKVDAQIDSLLAFCKQKGWKTQKVFSEKVSGVASNGKRVVFNKLIEECKSGKFVRIVVYDLSRLSRKGVADTIETINFLQKRGVEIVSMREGLSFDGQMGLAMASLFSALANIDYEMRREKCREGIEKVRQANDGKCHWGGSTRTRDTSNDKAILALKKEGISIRKIAKKLSCSPTTVQKVVNLFK